MVGNGGDCCWKAMIWKVEKEMNLFLGVVILSIAPP